MSGINIDSRELESNMSELRMKTLLELKMYCGTKSKEMEGYAKRYRPWTDRTGHARQRLTGFVKEDTTKGELYVGIAHGVPYGTSLELGHEKRYAILFPTLRRYSETILRGVSHIMERIRI